MKTNRLAALWVLPFVSISAALAQSKPLSIQDIQATLKTLQPASQAVLRVRRDARQDDAVEPVREQIRELRRFLSRLERESLQQGQIVPDPKLTGTPGQAAANRTRRSKPNFTERLRNRTETLRSTAKTRREGRQIRGRRAGSGLPQKAFNKLLDHIQSELDKPGQLNHAKLREIKGRTKLKSGQLDKKLDDKTPTLSTIIEHRRDF